MTDIDPRIHRVLDGELPLEQLPAELRPAVERLLGIADALGRAPAASVEARVMAALKRTRARRLLRWLAQRHAVTFQVRPIWSLAFAMLLAAIAIVPSHKAGDELGPGEGIAQFVLPAAGAHSVHVAGTFNDWRPTALPLENHDGVWRATVVLPVGQHEYMFVVDGERWVPDPLAGRYVDDGFGRENAILIVRSAEAPDQ